MWFYGVKRGHSPGVYKTWNEAKKQVEGFKGCRHAKFKTYEEAREFIESVDDINVTQTRAAKKLKRTHQEILDSIVKPNGEIITVYTDGSAINNGQKNARAGYGVYWGENDPRNLSEPLDMKPATNQKAELMAVIRALEVCGDDDKTILILTDSVYVIKCMTVWIHSWKKKGWKTSTNKMPENSDLILRLEKLINERTGEVMFQHVNAHSGIDGNENADALAKSGAIKAKSKNVFVIPIADIDLCGSDE